MFKVIQGAVRTVSERVSEMRQRLMTVDVSGSGKAQIMPNIAQVPEVDSGYNSDSDLDFEVREIVIVLNRGECACRIANSFMKDKGTMVVVPQVKGDETALHLHPDYHHKVLPLENGYTQEVNEVGEDGKPCKVYDFSELKMAIKSLITKYKVPVKIHPGWGFLSEVQVFFEAMEGLSTELLESNGSPKASYEGSSARFSKRNTVDWVKVIGPGSEAIGIMGDKTKTIDQLEKYGARVIPGKRRPFLCSIPESEVSAKWEELQGMVPAGANWTWMLKATDLGGGRGITPFDDLASFKERLAETKTRLGEQSVFIERKMENCGHHEFQMFWDRTGKCIVLPARDCSQQYLYKKSIEKSKRKGFGPDHLRDQCKDIKTSMEAMHADKVISGPGIGTNETLGRRVPKGTGNIGNDKDGDAGFIEINPRLQVEHKITELTILVDEAGIPEWLKGVLYYQDSRGWHPDFVALMTLLNDGYTFDELGIVPDAETGIPNGWEQKGVALEARLLAVKGAVKNGKCEFQGVNGTVSSCEFPEGDGIVVLPGIAPGTKVDMTKDSMIAKVIVIADTMGEAIDKMDTALHGVQVTGIPTNRDYLIHENGALKTIYEASAETEEERHSLDFTTTTLDELMPGILSRPPVQPLEQTTAMQMDRFLSSLMSRVVGDESIEGMRSRDEMPQQPIQEMAVDTESGAVRGWADFFTGSTDTSLEVNADLAPSVRVDRQIKAFVKAALAHPRPLVVDTLFRDAWQSLLANRVRSFERLAIASGAEQALGVHSVVAEAIQEMASEENKRGGAFALEVFGGALNHVMWRMGINPWVMIRELRQKMPHMMFQALVRGSLTAYGVQHQDVVESWYKAFADSAGPAIARNFDANNSKAIFRVMADATIKARENGAVLVNEMAVSYKPWRPSHGEDGPFSNQYYVDMIKYLVHDCKADIICLKDMAGQLTPDRARPLFEAIAKAFPRTEYPDLLIDIHMHDTKSEIRGGVEISNAIAVYKLAQQPEFNGLFKIVDVASGPFSGGASQPSRSEVVSELELEADFDTEQGAAFDEYLTRDMMPYVKRFWQLSLTDKQRKEAMKLAHKVEMPGGQVGSFVNQLFGVLGDVIPDAKTDDGVGFMTAWDMILHYYKYADHVLGDLVKVTPLAKVVGDMAMFMVKTDMARLEAAKTWSAPEEHESKAESLQRLISSLTDFDLGFSKAAMSLELSEDVSADNAERLRDALCLNLGHYVIDKSKNDTDKEDLVFANAMKGFPKDAVAFFVGEMSVPPNGFPERLRELVLKAFDKARIEDGVFPGSAKAKPDFSAKRAEIKKAVEEQLKYSDALPLFEEIDWDTLPDEVVVEAHQYFANVVSYYVDFVLKGDWTRIPVEIWAGGITPGYETDIELRDWTKMLGRNGKIDLSKEGPEVYSTHHFKYLRDIEEADGNHLGVFEVDGKVWAARPQVKSVLPAPYDDADLPDVFSDQDMEIRKALGLSDGQSYVIHQGRTPMAGKVTSVVEANRVVQEGESAEIEAMKMQHDLGPKPGDYVLESHISVGDIVGPNRRAVIFARAVTV